MLRYAKKVLKLAKISFKLGLLADVSLFEKEVTKSNVVDNKDLGILFLNIFQNFIFSYFVIIFYLIDFYLIFFFLNIYFAYF